MHGVNKEKTQKGKVKMKKTIKIIAAVLAVLAVIAVLITSDSFKDRAWTDISVEEL
jgi:hypothetical protein